jgi:hypothetical protein
MIYQHQLSTLVLDHLHDIYMCLRCAFAPVYLSISIFDECHGHVLLRVMSLCCHVVVLWVSCAIVCLCCSLEDRAFEPVREL